MRSQVECGLLVTSIASLDLGSGPVPLAGSLASFPLPEFFGLQLSGVEIRRNGQFLTLYANLVAGA